MKNLVLVILVAASVLFGGLYLWQGAQTSRREARIAELEAMVKRKETEARKSAGAEKKAKEIRERLSQSAARAAQRASQVAQLEQELAKTSTNAEPSSGFGALFKSPEMREMIKTQQKAFIGPMLEQNYGALFRQLHLTDEQKNYLKELLEKRALVAAESGMEMFTGGAEPAQREEMMKKIKDETEAATTQIKQFLGDAIYPQFESYEQTLPERMQLSQYNQTVAGSETQLNPEQEQQLLNAMVAERTNFNWLAQAPDQSQFKGNLAEMFSEDWMNKFADQKAQLDQRVLVQAQQILSPPQYASFERFINANRELQVNAMKIGAKMFAPKAGQAK